MLKVRGYIYVIGTLFWRGLLGHLFAPSGTVCIPSLYGVTCEISVHLIGESLPRSAIHVVTAYLHFYVRDCLGGYRKANPEELLIIW